MRAVVARLVRTGVVARALATDLRAGKAAATNLAIGACGGDIVVTLDAGCSLDRFALEALVAPFADSGVGAVAAEIMPRNGNASLTARVQTIEYLMPMSAARPATGSLGRVVCVSGVCGAFRRTALERVGGMNASGGEDLDVPRRLRLAGWRIAHAPDALCHAEVPTRPGDFLRQRLAAERDAIRVRFRRHARPSIPFLSSILAVRHGPRLEAVVAGAIGAGAFPIYLAWLVAHHGRMSFAVLLAMQFALFAMDLAILALASIVVLRPARLADLLYLPAYSIYAGWIIRGVRLAAYLQESYVFSVARDDAVPAGVRTV
jgi:hypothetical protein